MLEKFNEAFSFSESVWNKNELFFEADLLLGLNLFKKKDYKNSEKYFHRLNQISKYNLYFDDFVGNILIAWSKASQGKSGGRDVYFRWTGGWVGLGTTPTRTNKKLRNKKSSH